MGANLKQNIVTGVRNMLASINEFARSHTSSGTQQEATAITMPPEPEEPPFDQSLLLKLCTSLLSEPFAWLLQQIQQMSLR